MARSSAGFFEVGTRERGATLGGGSGRFFEVGADGVRERGAMLGGGSGRFFEVGADGVRDRGAMLGGGCFFAFLAAFDAF
ncbi:hypothetical protein [Polyangium sorediatum]|uniref:Uncharacterized protein n=1 Tax=Polyangium sorediatum TaxID=889274 RepID=A0ABT6P2V9_9BACT|nr:hypothetical protein [Polyangium sorediatum]MDI1434946.1 hypothetical protein [Polyangium sorediatum]